MATYQSMKPMSSQEIQMSSESEEIFDSASFSGLAFVGFVLAAIAAVSFQTKVCVPLGITGAVLGAVSLLIANRCRLSLLSKILGFLAVTLGATFSSWSISSGLVQDQVGTQQARVIALQYLEGLSQGDVEKVKNLVGVITDVPEPGATIKSQGKLAGTRLQNDPVHLEIQQRKGPAQWDFVSVEASVPRYDGHYYRLRYRDMGQTNPPAYLVKVRRLDENEGDKNMTSWFVDSLQRPTIQPK